MVQADKGVIDDMDALPPTERASSDSSLTFSQMYSQMSSNLDRLLQDLHNKLSLFDVATDVNDASMKLAFWFIDVNGERHGSSLDRLESTPVGRALSGLMYTCLIATRALIHLVNLSPEDQGVEMHHSQ